MKNIDHMYLGRSAELAVLTELLARGYNASSPLLDSGADIFAVRDFGEGFWRVQVKASNATECPNGKYRASFGLHRKQIFDTTGQELYYVFAVWRHGAWAKFLIVP